jgi:DNA polymerase I-like protein with 3'-5' exonuclease and polymerase domains
LKVIIADIETLYSSKDGYTLRKLTPPEYILDPRFEAIGCAFQEGVDGKPYWVEGPDLPRFFGQLDTNVLMVSHNWLFDGAVFHWRFGYTPRLMACTMAISKATLRHRLKHVSLDSVSRELGLPDKGTTVRKVDGMCLAAIKQAGYYDEYVQYCKRDCANCAGIFKRLVVDGYDDKRALFPMAELLVLDAVLRAAVDPRFKLDPNVLAEHLTEVKAQKEALLAQAMLIGVDGKSDLMSNEKFAQLLRNAGVDPPTKISARTGKQTYAFAKTDVAFLELAEHENPAVQALVEARLGAKSTLEETRTQRYIAASCLNWPKHLVGSMPMPLSYAGAHTHRLSGEWKLNVQNLPRGGQLRRALVAPDGHKVLVVDASQIEAREVAYFSDQTDLVRQFAAGEDVYASFASVLHGHPVNKKDHPQERHIGKTCILGLGYGLGWVRLRDRLKADKITLGDEEAYCAVATYRSYYSCIPAAWRLLDSEGIGTLARGGRWEWGPFEFVKDKVVGPNGLCLHYNDLTYGLDRKTGRQQWTFKYAGNEHNLYGGKLMENLCQFAARIHTLDAAVRITKRSEKEIGVRYSLAQQAHDENVFVVNDEHVDRMKVIMKEEMCQRPSWAPGLPLATDPVGVGQSYGDAK